MNDAEPNNPWTDALLEPFTLRGDPYADHVMEEVMSAGEPESIHRLLMAVNRNDDLIPIGMPEILREYLISTAHLPLWTDLEKIAIAQRLFARYGMQIVLTLFCIVLPQGYTIWKPTQILSITNNLGRHIHRRVVETAQFLLDVMAPDGFAKAGRAIRSIQKVRLIHAASRRYVRAQSAWRDEWGTPINQEDMAATLGGFSYLSLEGLGKLNLELSQHEQEAMLHTWWVIGHLLGVDSSLKFETMESAAQYMEAYRRRGARSTEAGLELTKSLTDFMNSRLPRLLKGTPEAFMVFFLGDATASLIGLAKEEHRHIVRVQKLSQFFDRLQRSTRLRRLSGVLTFAILERLLASEVGGKSVQFQIPVLLRREWNIEAAYRRVRRQEWRWAGRVALETGSGESRQLGRPLNISPQGLKLRLLPVLSRASDVGKRDIAGRQPLRAGMRVKLHFDLPEVRSFVLWGVVRHVQPSPTGLEIGIRFRRRDLLGRRHLDRILNGRIAMAGLDEEE